MQGKKIILPIWHNVSYNDVVKFSPPLADKLAIPSTAGSPTRIAVKIIEVVRPDLLTKIHRRLAFRFAPSRLININPREIKWSTIFHEELPAELIGRIRLVRIALLGAYTHSMEFWLDGFKRDAHPSREVAYWERVAAVYLEYAKMMHLRPAQHETTVHLIHSLLEGSSEQKVSALAAQLPDGALEKLRNLLAYKYPFYDIKEELKIDDYTGDGLDPLHNNDKESFPEDLPEDLIQQLVREIQTEEDDGKE